MTERTRRFLISGKVQGVCYRASAERRAHELAITGWVRNLADGRVEVMASAPPERLQQFQRWLSDGPERAEVEQVEREDFPLQAFADFVVGSTAAGPAHKGP